MADVQPWAGWFSGESLADTDGTESPIRASLCVGVETSGRAAAIP